MAAKSGVEPTALVEQALALFDDLAGVLKDSNARVSIPNLVKRINLRLWLNFGEGKKGKRIVRILEGGLLTTSDAAPPVRP